MGELMRRWMQIMAEPQNLYSGGDLSFSRMKQVTISLPTGIYVFSAAITSTDTDANVCCVRFMQQDDKEASEEDFTEAIIARSVSGESHSKTYHVIAPVHHLYLYASTNYPRTAGDTAQFKNIRIWRIG